MGTASPLSMAPDPSQSMPEHNDKATGFFSLPRELRDRIYEMVREDRRKKLDDIRFGFRAAIPEKRLVNRQFKSEYDERSAVNTFVHVFDFEDVCTFEHFPRLALNACYLALHWESTCDEDELNIFLSPGARIELPLEIRLKSLERLAGHLPKIKDVHIQLKHPTTHDLKDVVNDLIACPVLTSFTIKSRKFSGVVSVDFAIWSREHGFLVDNTDKEKAMQEVQAGCGRYLKRRAAEMKKQRGCAREILQRQGSRNGKQRGRDSCVRQPGLL